MLPDNIFVKFNIEWFYGSLGSLMIERGWGRDAGCPARRFVSAKEAHKIPVYYKIWILQRKPCFQSVNIFKKGLKGGTLVALEKIFLDIDAPDLEKAFEAEKKVFEHLCEYGKVLVVFSGRKGYHNYLWLPVAVAGEPVFLKTLYKEILARIGLDKLAKKIHFIDKSVFEAARISRVPFTVHEKSSRLVQPLDEEFKPIEHISIKDYVKDPIPKEVVEEAYSHAKTRLLLEKAKIYRAIMGLERRQLKKVALSLPDYVQFILENGVDEGYRNNAAFILATWLKAQGNPPHTVLEQLIEWNYRNRPPLEVKELEYVVESVFKHDYKPVSRRTAEEWLSLQTPRVLQGSRGEVETGGDRCG